jgi:hypothetical protein
MKKCLNCDTDISDKRNSKFCSNQCQADYGWKIKKEEILISGKVEKYNPNLLKRYLKELHGHKCEICKNTEWMGQAIPLILDHIDGNPENHVLTNLRLICSNCDAQTETFAGRNRGNGRFNRRQRYKEGKSY